VEAAGDSVAVQVGVVSDHVENRLWDDECVVYFRHPLA